MVRRQRLVGTVDVQANDHLQDGDGVLQVDGVGGGLRFFCGDSAAGAHAQAALRYGAEAGSAHRIGAAAVGACRQINAGQKGMGFPTVGHKVGIQCDQYGVTCHRLQQALLIRITSQNANVMTKVRRTQLQ